jgi:hypothetical protein
MAATAIAKVAKSSNRGSKPGERRGGRAPGVPNKATATIKEIAREYTAEAVKALVDVLRGGEGIPPAAQVAAAKEILDRGYGKASQVIAGDEDGGPLRTVTVVELVAPEQAALPDDKVDIYLIGPDESAG